MGNFFFKNVQRYKDTKFSGFLIPSGGIERNQ